MNEKRAEFCVAICKFSGTNRIREKNVKTDSDCVEVGGVCWMKFLLICDQTRQRDVGF